MKDLKSRKFKGSLMVSGSSDHFEFGSGSKLKDKNNLGKELEDFHNSVRTGHLNNQIVEKGKRRYCSGVI